MVKFALSSLGKLWLGVVSYDKLVDNKFNNRLFNSGDQNVDRLHELVVI
jgi:hypothetical protein